MSKLISIVQYSSQHHMERLKGNFACLKHGANHKLDRVRLNTFTNVYDTNSSAFRSTNEFLQLLEANHNFFVEFNYDESIS